MMEESKYSKNPGLYKKKIQMRSEADRQQDKESCGEY